MIRFQAERLFSRIRKELWVPLYANAYTLIFNQITSSALGMIYWTAAARLYSPEEVGQNTAIISTMLFLADLAEFSLKSAMTRFVPRAGGRIRKLVLSAYAVNIVMALIITVLFYLLDGYFHFTSVLLSETRLLPTLLFFTPLFWVIFYVQDGVLTGLREPKWVLFENTIYNFLKIVFLGAALFTPNRYVIVASWFLPTPFLILLVNGLIFFNFIPRARAKIGDQGPSITVKQVAASVGGDHVGTILAEACIRLLPLMVLNMLSKDANAYYYEAWLIGNAIYLIAYNLASSFSVEASSNLHQIATYSRKILIQKARLVIPLALAVLAFAPWIMSIFGAEYARQATTLLRWLALATLPMIVNIWYLGYARVLGDSFGIIRNQGLTSLITLGLSYLWLPRFGITSIGIAWFIAQSLVALIVIYLTGPILLGNLTHHTPDRSPTINTRLRRVDWRFLSTVLTPKNSLSVGERLLSNALASITTDRAEGSQFTSAQPVELAAAVNPGTSRARSIQAALCPEGVFYSEWSFWTPGGLRTIKRRLRSAGFASVEFFWAYPSVHNPQLWLSLDAGPGALRYLANRLIAGDGPVRDFLQRRLSQLLGIMLHLGWVPRISAIAYKNPSPRRDVFSVIREQWFARFPQGFGSPLSFIVQTGGSQLYSKIIYLVFPKDDEVPCWIVKLPRLPEDAASLKNEQMILEQLERSALDQQDGMIIPKNIFSCEWDGTWIAAQTALEGASLSKIVSHKTAAEFSKRMTGWQIALAHLSRNKTDDPFDQRVIRGFMEKFDRAVAPRLKSDEQISARQVLSCLEALPSVCAHNDFAPWNVMVSRDRLGVFDWADAELNSLPMLDLFYGLTHLFFLVEDAWDIQHKIQVYRTLSDPATELGQLFDSCIQQYAAEVQIPDEKIPALRLATWVLHCHFEYQNRKIEQFPEQLAGRNESDCLSLLLEELEIQREKSEPQASKS